MEQKMTIVLAPDAHAQLMPALAAFCSKLHDDRAGADRFAAMLAHDVVNLLQLMSSQGGESIVAMALAAQLMVERGALEALRVAVDEMQPILLKGLNIPGGAQ